MIRRIAVGLAAIGVALAAILTPAAPAAASQTSYPIYFGYSGKCIEPTYVRQQKPLHQWTCDGASFQQWYFDYVGQDAQGIVYWRIRNTIGGLCMNLQGDNRGVLSQGTCGAWGWDDVWQLKRVEGHDFYHRLVNMRSKMCATLGADSRGKANGGTIFQQTCGMSVDPAHQYVALT
ncbi:MAG TPA: hypothetical protein DGG94_16310 [Micromonosporaceae bacterium]|nr:hypothetical protein [Micromonosporaceae bacterium]HCU51334.1 hypothetical protein [Micromonosporaceae bacterium]